MIDEEDAPVRGELHRPAGRQCHRTGASASRRAAARRVVLVRRRGPGRGAVVARVVVVDAVAAVRCAGAERTPVVVVVVVLVMVGVGAPTGGRSPVAVHVAGGTAAAATVAATAAHNGLADAATVHHVLVRCVDCGPLLRPQAAVTADGRAARRTAPTVRQMGGRS